MSDRTLLMDRYVALAMDDTGRMNPTMNPDAAFDFANGRGCPLTRDAGATFGPDLEPSDLIEFSGRWPVTLRALVLAAAAKQSKNVKVSDLGLVTFTDPEETP